MLVAKHVENVQPSTQIKNLGKAQEISLPKIQNWALRLRLQNPPPTHSIFLCILFSCHTFSISIVLVQYHPKNSYFLFSGFARSREARDIFLKTCWKPPSLSANSRDPLVTVAMAVCKFFATSLCDLPAANCFTICHLTPSSLYSPGERMSRKNALSKSLSPAILWITPRSSSVYLSFSCPRSFRH